MFDASFGRNDVTKIIRLALINNAKFLASTKACTETCEPFGKAEETDSTTGIFIIFLNYYISTSCIIDLFLVLILSIYLLVKGSRGGHISRILKLFKVLSSILYVHPYRTNRDFHEAYRRQENNSSAEDRFC